MAILLGTSGIGTLSLYQSVLQAAQTISNMGIPTSGVREISDSVAHATPIALNRAIVTVRRLSLLTGILGLILTAGLSDSLSQVLGQGDTMATDLKFLGCGVFFLCLALGESAILQGLRELRAVAGTQVISVVIGLPLLLGPCFVWGAAGMAPGLATAAAATWGITRYATRSLGEASSVSWQDVWRTSGPLLRFGAAMMGNAAAASIVALATRALVTRSEGLESNGILQAAMMLAGIFVTFLFSAMGTDFLPRLTAAKSDFRHVNRLVNEQIEVAVLLCSPGLLLTLALSPWLIQLFYSADFASAATLVPWFLVGNLLQIFGWPLGFLQMVLARPRTYLLTQTAFHLSQISLIVLLLPTYGLYAVAATFLVCYLCYLFCIAWYARRKTGFRFTRGSISQITTSGALFSTALAVSISWGPQASAAVVAPLAFVSAVVSGASLSKLLPDQHKLQPLLKIFRITSRSTTKS